MAVKASGNIRRLRIAGPLRALRKPSAIRSKLDTAAMTEATQMSQLLISCLQEIQDQHALPGGAKDKILQDFVDGDNNL